MKRIKQLFQRFRREQRCGLIAYLTCGDGDTVRFIEELERAGADAIELGVPFSDPIADGPVIQAAAQRALRAQTSMPDVFEIARAVRSRSKIPLIAFSYFNPVLRYGTQKFANDAAGCGIDSVLITDLPPEASKEFRDTMHLRGLGTIFLLAPTSNAKRIAAIDRASDGFVYYVSTTGVTGARRELDPALLTRLDEIRAKLKKPIAVGFGVSEPEHYATLRDRCDAVAVGSAIVRAIGDGKNPGDVVRRILGA